jgi:hypothetical protein
MMPQKEWEGFGMFRAFSVALLLLPMTAASSAE